MFGEYVHDLNVLNDFNGPSALIVHLRPPKYSNCGGCDQTNGGGTEKDLWQNFLS